MRYLKTVSGCLLAMALHSTTWAQVYETTDAEGNPEFTDSPPTENAEVVDLQETNLADAPAPEAQEQEQSQPAQQTGEQAPVQVNNNININNGGDGYDDDGDVEGAYAEDPALRRETERQVERDAAVRPGQVGDPRYEMPREVGDSEAQMPREVGDSPAAEGERRRQ